MQRERDEKTGADDAATSPSPPTRATIAAEAARERLAAALRENLLKRKAQARARRSGTAADAGPGTCHTPDTDGENR